MRPQGRLPVRTCESADLRSASRRPGRLLGTPGLLGAWVVTRLLLILLIAGQRLTHSDVSVFPDLRLYVQWVTHTLTHGHLPAADPFWQYPPGAAAVLLAPRWIGGNYVLGFLVLMMLADAVVLAALLHTSRSAGRRPVGAWFWVAAVALLGPVSLARFDLIPVALGVTALAVATRRPRIAGVLIGVGVLIKAWPVLLLYGVEGGRTRRRTVFALAATVAGGFCLALLVYGWSESASFLGHEKHRGLQVEAVAATPFAIFHAFGYGHPPETRYGASEFLNHGAGTAATLVSVLLVLMLVALLVTLCPQYPRTLRHRFVGMSGGSASAALTLIFGVLVLGKVLSPQYFLWALGVAAFDLSQPAVDSADSRRRAVCAGLLLICCALSQLVYPNLYRGLLRGETLPTVALVLRNMTLVVTTILSINRFRIASRLPVGARQDPAL